MSNVFDSIEEAIFSCIFCSVQEHDDCTGCGCSDTGHAGTEVAID